MKFHLTPVGMAMLDKQLTANVCELALAKCNLQAVKPKAKLGICSGTSTMYLPLNFSLHFYLFVLPFKEPKFITPFPEKQGKFLNKGHRTDKNAVPSQLPKTYPKDPTLSTYIKV